MCDGCDGLQRKAGVGLEFLPGDGFEVIKSAGSNCGGVIRAKFGRRDKEIN